MSGARALGGAVAWTGGTPGRGGPVAIASGTRARGGAVHDQWIGGPVDSAMAIALTKHGVAVAFAAVPRDGAASVTTLELCLGAPAGWV
jgi:hypothetical protein